MSVSDLERIEQLEKEIGHKLKKLEFEKIFEGGQTGFALDEHEQVIGLNLAGIKLEPIAESLSIFQHLQKLILHGSQIKDISFLQGLSNLSNLYLWNNQITNISFLQGLSHLTRLDLSNNQITDISFLQKLSNLNFLNLRNNQITDISFLQRLSHLTRLVLSNNKIKELPETLIESGLEIDVESYTEVENKMYLRGNPLEKPPLEIIKKGKTAIKSYFESLKAGTLPLNEVKVLLVGEGGSGKTSLVKRLLGLDFNIEEPQTHGISIMPWVVKKGDQTIKVHLWDFGGQEIMHATHQFFLSKRSLYLLVLDGRKDEKTEYWLKHIENFGGNSPVVAVINKIDENPGFDLNRKFLQAKYPVLKSFYRVSCKTNEGFDTLVPALEKALFQVDITRTTWAAPWFAVKTQLENMKEPFLSYQEYRGICSQQNITEKSSQDTLVDFLNDLGVILHFKDLELDDIHVLDPRWVTEAVYKIINSKQLAERYGVLQLDLLEEILKPTNDRDYYYPSDKYRYIIELMIKFELCYKLDAQQVLIPDLLAVQESSFDFDYGTSLKFIIDYDFLPRSVMPRFIVRQHRDIKEGLQWRTGVVLEDKYFHSTAVVKSDEIERRIFIYVNGTQKRDYFSVIRKTLQDINRSFDKLKTIELVPLPDNPEITIEYEELLGYESAGMPEIFIGKLRKKYSVSRLLDGIDEKDWRDSRAVPEEKRLSHALRDTEEKITANIPSGVGSYEEIREKNCYYVDKSEYLRNIEKAGMYLFFIRPRRFGKTLFISMMETYYDVDKIEQFEFYFTGTAIFENPTPERNSYLILKFDFSGIESSVEQVEKSFLHHVKNRAEIFISKYKELLNIDEETTIAEIKNQENPSDILSRLLTLCEKASRKIYIIIDEYDNFANTILSTVGEKDYEALTHGEGFFKTFFAAIKKGTSGYGIPIGRLFMTGVSPITLDDVTSGFNIGENISIDRAFNEMLGFRQQEVIDLIEYYREAGDIRHETAYLFDIMNDWYNHYRFCKESGPTLFNPTLVMYFLKEYRKNFKIPDDLVDRNVRTDYEKLRHLILIDKMGEKKPNGNFSKLQAVIENAFVTTKLQKSFSLKKLMQPENFYTLLFYFGLLTIVGSGKNEQSRLAIPNETIKRLYYEYIKDVYTEMEIFTLDLDDYYRMMADMAYKGKWKPMFEYISKRMEASMGLRDLIDKEKPAQVFLLAYLGLSNLYFTHSEKELGKGYADIVLEPFMAKYEGIKYSYLIEIKYMKPDKNKEKEKEKLEKLKADAEKQLDKYSMDEKFAKSIGKTDLIKLVLVFSGHRLVYIDAVRNGK